MTTTIKQASASIKIKDFREASTGSDDSSDNGRFICYLATKNGKLCQYELNITESQISIISSSRQKVKSTLATATIHVKESPKQARESNPSDDDTASDSPTG